MKQKVIDILNNHKWSPSETWLTSDIICEEDFDKVADSLVKSFIMPINGNDDTQGDDKKLCFDELKESILKSNAKSEYKQASIVMLRTIFGINSSFIPNPPSPPKRRFLKEGKQPPVPKKR